MITQEHTISEILEAVPDAVTVLQMAGLDCFGCEGGSKETLKFEADKKNISDKSLQAILDRINRMKEEQEGRITHIPQPEDHNPIEITEGNKTYTKIAGLMFTPAAITNLQQLATAAGLRIRVESGGCSGFKYQYDFFDSPEENEGTYQLTDNLAIYLDDFSFDKLYGSVVDFSLGLHGSGLQIINPNIKRTCSCGTSIGF